MDDMVIAEKLQAFGLTRQEAAIYLCLCRNGTLTGYEAAKLTGISRSNVYNALAGLTEKGAAYLMEGSASRYTPVPVGELCDDKLRAMREAKVWLEQNVPRAIQPEDGYITIVGEQQIWTGCTTCWKARKRECILPHRGNGSKPLRRS